MTCSSGSVVSTLSRRPRPRVTKSQVPPVLIPEGGLIGPVYLFTATETGSDVIRDSDGNILKQNHSQRMPAVTGPSPVTVGSSAVAS